MAEENNERRIAELEAELEKLKAAAVSSTEVHTDSGVSNLGHGNIINSTITVSGEWFGDKQRRQRERTLLARYLVRVIGETRPAGLHVLGTDIQKKGGFQLDAIFTQLDTVQPKRDERDEGLWHQREADGEPTEQERITALEFVGSHLKAAIIGAPGSGKSTMGNMLTLCLASNLLNDPEHATLSLETLGEAWQDQDANALIPIRILLRHFTAATDPKEQAPSFWEYFANQLENECDALDELPALLKEHLQAYGGLLFLDGLDEVPDECDRREQIKRAVARFEKDFPKARILITSRTYAWLWQGWELPGFETAALAPFHEGQQEYFITQWYQHLSTLQSNLTAQDAENRAKELVSRIRSNRYLPDLAQRPLLLTYIAALHSVKGRHLPEKREQLYEESVRLLLDAWEEEKRTFRPGTDGEAQEYIQDQAATEYFNLESRDDLLKALEKLAFEAHDARGHEPGVADIPGGKLIAALEKISGKNALDIRDYVRDRAGILTHDGEDLYRFPHRTFQEYLAARHLARDGFPDKLCTLVKQAPQQWREVFLLAGAHASRSGETPFMAWSLIDALLPAPPPRALSKLEDSDWLAAAFAGQLLVETEIGLAESFSDSERPKRDRVVKWLEKLVSTGQLDAIDRARCGNDLGLLGDPRQGVALSKDGKPDLLWVEIPAGTFLYGEEQQTKSIAEPFAITAYTITNAQFSVFVDAVGYAEDRFWDAEWDRPDSRAELPEGFGGSNQPAVYVSWYEAKAYCRWLNELFPDRHHDLPSEQEWERAARGTDGRKFPWGEDETDAVVCCNCEATGVGRTVAVGSFPHRNHPNACHDTAGNVWEWCQNDRGLGKELRGGSFYENVSIVRCASRNWLNPRIRFTDFGFRVLCRPPASSA